MKNFGECLKAAREKAGLTQIELAKRLDLPTQNINRYENSMTEPKVGLVMRIAQALNISLDELLQHNAKKDIPTIEELNTMLAPAFKLEAKTSENYLLVTLKSIPMDGYKIKKGDTVDLTKNEIKLICENINKHIASDLPNLRRRATYYNFLAFADSALIPPDVLKEQMERIKQLLNDPKELERVRSLVNKRIKALL